MFDAKEPVPHDHILSRGNHPGEIEGSCPQTCLRSTTNHTPVSRLRNLPRLRLSVKIGRLRLSGTASNTPAIAESKAFCTILPSVPCGRREANPAEWGPQSTPMLGSRRNPPSMHVHVSPLGKPWREYCVLVDSGLSSMRRQTAHGLSANDVQGKFATRAHSQRSRQVRQHPSVEFRTRPSFM